MNSGGSGNARTFSQCAASKISIDTKSAKEHTQCSLVEKGHIITMTNRQHSAGIVDRDTMNWAIEHIRPDFMPRSVLLSRVVIDCESPL